MATANLRVVHPDPVPGVGQTGSGGHNGCPKVGQSLHRVQEVRQEQGVSLRTAARRMGSDMRSVKAQEQSTSDLRLSQLYAWQQVLDVPLNDLLEEPGLPLSSPVLERARLIRLMKTVMSIQEKADSPAIERLAQVLVEQLVEVMPELAEVSAWHNVGQRRSLDECGRVAENPIPDSFLGGVTNVIDHD